jgi:hypothetical protein
MFLVIDSSRRWMREREDTIAHATKFGKEKHFILKKRVGTESTDQEIEEDSTDQ